MVSYLTFTVFLSYRLKMSTVYFWEVLKGDTPYSTLVVINGYKKR